MTLDLTDVSLTLGDGADEVRALDHVDLHVAAGEVIAVVGPSGSGKSSLLAVAGAMLTPTSGTILVDGVDLGAIDDAARTRLRRERVGFVFQGVNLLPSLTALEQLLLLPHLDGVRPATQRQRAAELPGGFVRTSRRSITNLNRHRAQHPLVNALSPPR